MNLMHRTALSDYETEHTCTAQAGHTQAPQRLPMQVGCTHAHGIRVTPLFQMTCAAWTPGVTLQRPHAHPISRSRAWSRMLRPSKMKAGFIILA